jgi:plastocyanin
MDAAPPPPPARVQVVAREFSFTLSRPAVRAGTVVIELVDLGQDPHDLNLQRAGSSEIQDLGAVGPGGRAQYVVSLSPGRYRLFCSIADHWARGMQATLVVRRR